MIGRRIFLMAMLGIFTVKAGAQNVTGAQVVNGNAVRCMLSNGSAVDFSPASANMVRVEYRVNNQGSQLSQVMDSSYSSSLLFISVDTSGAAITLTGTNYSVSIAKTPFGIVFKNSQGATLFSSTSVGQYTLNGTVIAGNYYGVRNQTYGYDENVNLTFYGNPSLQLFQGVVEGGAASPFIWTTNGFGLLIDEDDGVWSLSGTTLTNSRASGTVTNSNCLFFLIAGTPLQIMAGYYKASGSFSVPPRWTCGFMNSQWGLSESELKTIMQTYRADSIPIDAFIFDYDWFFYNNQNGVANGDFKWNTVNFPGASTAVGSGFELKNWMDSIGAKMIGIRKPHGAWTGLSDANAGCGNFYDPSIRAKFWNMFIDSMNASGWNCRARGIVGWWNDEADGCSNGNKPFMFLYMERSFWDGMRGYAGLTNAYANDRVWSINRAYFGGCQRYAFAHWSGDITSSNQSMMDQRKFMLTSVNLGSAWWSMDIGGFQSAPTSADYLHWMQFGAFVPVYRVHCTNGCKKQPWVYNDVADARMYINLRYSLIPYIYSAYWKLHLYGAPLVRPLIMDYPSDPNVAQDIDAWMFGDNILVSPVVNGTTYSNTTKSVYLPAGIWVNFWNDKQYLGGQTVALPVTVDTIPVLVKQGAIIPKQPVVQYLSNYPVTPNANNAVEPVIFHVYGGANDTFTYYDDDGVTWNYEKGQYRSIVYQHLSGNQNERVIVGQDQQSWVPTYPDSNGYFVFHSISWTPNQVTIPSGNITAKQVASSALSAAVAPAWARDSVHNTVSIKVVSPFTAGTVGIAVAAGVAREDVERNYLDHMCVILLKDRLLVSVSLPDAVLTALNIRLITSKGALVREYRLTSLPGKGAFSVPVNALPQGVYFAVLSTSKSSVVKKLVAAVR